MIFNNFRDHFLLLNKFYSLFLIIFLLFCISVLGQYSAFNGEFSGAVQSHLLKIALGIIVMFLVYISGLKTWSNCAYLFYAISFVALVVVQLLGITKLGAQRWINLHFFTFQPSELMKLSLILALARYYSMLSLSEIKDIKNHFLPLLLTILPSILILRQPDLGTATIIFCVGIGIIFMSGFPMKFFLWFCAFVLSTCPFAWFFLHDYQKNRILTFLNPDSDPMGTGYHVLQSKIAIGSGKILGKGLLCGSQSKLSFLPEKNTDFIFTTIAEEVGFVGGTFIIFILLCLIFYFFWAASESKNTFSRLICSGFGILLFLHIFVNIAMVMGMVPVVGIPLPFLSYGGSSMITFMISCGLMMLALNSRSRM